jgi:acyl-CoA hydrolase
MPDRQRSTTLRFLAEPTDMNLYGRVHGGAVMKWIDQAGYACAVGWSGQYCVTVYVGGIRFYQPVHIGHVVEVHAKLIYTGRTSMHITVEVRAADPRDGIFTRTTQCVVVFVAIDAQTKPIEVPKWEPKTPDDLALHQYAVKLMELRKGIEEEMSRHGGQE